MAASLRRGGRRDAARCHAAGDTSAAAAAGRALARGDGAVNVIVIPTYIPLHTLNGPVCQGSRIGHETLIFGCAIDYINVWKRIGKTRKVWQAGRGGSKFFGIVCDAADEG